MAELEEEVKELKAAKQEEAYTAQPIGPVELTMSNFKQDKLECDIWWSLPFYTHPHGYKRCLDVDANGWGDGKGTHISVLVCLMRGKFDDRLKWPFRDDITIQLLSREEDNDHVIEVIGFTDATPDENGNRVTKEEQNPYVMFGDMLPHTDLKPKYLKNDHLSFFHQ